MAISFVGAGTVVTGSSLTVPAPAGIQQNDLLVLAIATNATSFSTPTGWTLVNSQTTVPKIYLFRKFATGTETSQAVTTGSSTSAGVMLAYHGASAIDGGSVNSITSTTIDSTQFIVNYPNEYVVNIYSMTTGVATWTAPASTTTRVNSAATATVDGLLIVDELQASAGLSTVRTATSSVSKALGSLAFSLIPSGRYWVGGTGTWDTTTTTNWSFSSNGAGGAAVPTAQDNVYFDQAGTYTTTITGALTCLDLTVSAGTVTFSGTGTPTINGSMSLAASTVWSGTGQITFNSITTGKTIQTNAVTLAAGLTFNGVGGSWILQGALTTSRAAAGAITLTNGTLDLNGYTATISASATATFLTATGTKNLTFNGGTLAIATSGTAFNNAAPTGFTTTAGTGTGTISLNSASAKAIAGGGSTFNCTLNQGGAGAMGFTGNNTFNNITATYTSTAATTITFTAGATTTVNSFTASGTAGKLLTLNSFPAGSLSTIVLAGGGSVTTPDYLSVSDIAFTPFVTDGSAPSYKWFAGANSTNGGNVTGMLFAAFATAATVYVLASGSNFTTPANWNNSNNTIHIFGAGGGGGGGLATSGTNHAGGGGGGGGGYTQLTNQTISGSVSYAIGAGGTAGTASGGTGGTGGTTTWNTTNTALGGTGGSTTAAPTSTGGLGGVGSTATGGAGGAGATNIAASLAAAGGGGGAAGPNGTGGAGGTGSSGTFGNASGGGGGGNGGGSAGGNGTTAGGAGGNNSAGAGGGAAGGNAGTRGGGGGGNDANVVGGVGGIGVDILNSIGGGGGAGGTGSTSAVGTNNTAYGGGGSGGSTSSGTVGLAGGAGGPGLIVVVYVPGAVTPSSGSFFFLF